MASKENIYFLRSFLLLIEGGLYISKEILSRECQKSENDLDELLKINERKLKHLFHDKQYKKLFPKFGKADINNWDLQLSVGVLINVFGSNLKAEKHKLRALSDLRNDIYMHCTDAALDESKYEEVIEELNDTITTLASTFDISVQQHCSNYIKQFTTGPLEAVRPSLPTLKGFSQLCQKKFKVGVETELVIGGPSSTWTNLCEHNLDTIFNHAESMASEDGRFQEIKENVERMLSYMERNKDVIFKGCKKTLSNEEEEQRHVVEISSEENIHENKAMAMTSRDVHKETKLIKQSEISLLLNFELQSEEALPQMLQTFKGTQFSDSLTKVADSLSRYCGSEITLKSSVNVGALLEALEESVFDKDALDKESESIYAKTSKEDELTLSVNDDMTSERIYTITSKEADLQSLQGTEEERVAVSVTDQKKQEDGYTRNSETESEYTEFDRTEASRRRGYIPGNYVRQDEDINTCGDLTNELEKVLLRRRAALEKSSSNEKVHRRGIVQTHIQADAPPIARKPSPGTIRRRRNTWHQSSDTVQPWDIEQTQKTVTPQPSMIDQKKLNMIWKRREENKTQIYDECELISKFLENMSSSIVHVWPAYDTKANDDIVFVVLTSKGIEDNLQVKDKLKKTGYNVFVIHVDSCSKESEQVLQKLDQLETNQCFSKLEDLGSVINKHSDRLLRNHQYISAISGSNVRSERFSLGQSEHLVSFQPCIVLYVIAKGKIPLHENKFEDNLDGIPVDVREGIFQRTILPSERYSKPVKMGCQITSNKTPLESFGTLGGFFYHKDFGLCGVTCAHVVLEEATIHDIRGEKKIWSKEESPMVFHPNTTQHEYKLGPVKEAVYRTGSEDSSGIDIAVFKIEGAAPDSGFFPEESEMCFETGRTLGTSDLKYNTPVLKYGRTTALTRGYIEFENITVRMIKYERKYTLGSNEYTFLLKNQIAVRPELNSCTQLFNDFGDSGAFVFVKDSDNQLVCIGICVGKLNTHGIIIPISAVKGDLGISKFCDFRWHRLSEKIKEMDEKLDTILDRLSRISSQ
ncbi:uncharacterized protein LOC132749034 [Ruditapes philippinarum]|uniref:uncharacterized protein LOC132749034 n=1 Tax=Ruditapes philippinarum TaxID=129788 RepID=UPI00295B856D|nr:uncharacterized protein LOC132749034 [Ruditapes philippinarum]